MTLGYFLPKIGRKIRIFSLGGNNIQNSPEFVPFLILAKWGIYAGILQHTLSLSLLLIMQSANWYDLGFPKKGDEERPFFPSGPSPMNISLAIS